MTPFAYSAAAKLWRLCRSGVVVSHQRRRLSEQRFYEQLHSLDSMRIQNGKMGPASGLSQLYFSKTHSKMETEAMTTQHGHGQNVTALQCCEVCSIRFVAAGSVLANDTNGQLRQHVALVENAICYCWMCGSLRQQFSTIFCVLCSCCNVSNGIIVINDDSRWSACFLNASD